MTYEVDVYPLNCTGEIQDLTGSLQGRGVRPTVEPSGEYSRVTFRIESDASVEEVESEIREWLLRLHVSTTAGPDGTMSRPFTVRERELALAF